MKVLLLFGFLVGLASAQDNIKGSAELKVTEPPSLKAQFPDGIYLRPAMFGSPMQISFDEKQIGGRVLVAPSDDSDGCKPINKTEFGVPNDDLSGYIILVSRGTCDFVLKVQHVQDIGAKAAIIINNQPGDFLPFMADDGNGTNIHIPSVLIRQKDGDLIKKTLASRASVIFSLSWNIPSPDNRVEWELWTSSDKDESDFKRNFDEVADVLGEATLFTPHYYINTYAQSIHRCYNPNATTVADLPCGKLCSNKGRYCWNNGLADGVDVMAENLRQICLWNAVNGTVNEPLWWDYVEEFDDLCNKDGEDNNFTAACSVAAFRQAATGDKLTIWNEVQSCVTKSGGADVLGNENNLFEKEIKDADERGIRYPTLFSILINGMPYYGGKSCPQPANIQTCNVLDVLCMGFKDPTSIAACSTSPTCKLGQKMDVCQVCGGPGRDLCGDCKAADDPTRVTDDASKCDSNTDTGGIPIWGTVMIVVVCAFLVAVGVYFFMQHRQNALKQDIDALMKQYMPMDASSDTASLNR